MGTTAERSIEEQILSAHVNKTVATIKEENAVCKCDGSDEAMARFQSAERERQRAERLLDSLRRSIE